ncbi:MAG: PKD domain-containing protein [Chitinophagales bacterium]|nr:PKD domain-containing protein [Chitinophagales bacterium]
MFEKTKLLLTILGVCLCFVGYTQPINPSNISNLQLWLKADSGIAASPVQTWSDVSGNGFAAVQPVSSKRPTQTAAVAVLNNHPVVTFSGTKFMRVLNLNQNSPLTIFALWNITASNTVPTLFDGVAASNRVILRQSAGTLTATAGQSLTYPKSATFNYIFNSIVYNGTNSELFENGNLKASGDLGTNTLVGFTIGANQDTSFTTYYLKGNVAEIIVYNKALSATERQQVEGYLRNKYAPPVALGPDTVISNSFCAYNLSAQQSWFTNYLWNTGATTPSIPITQTGTYSVTTTDLFGYQSSDTIVIGRPVFDSLSFVPPAKTICLGDSARLSVGLPQSGFAFNWSNGDSANVIFAKTQASYAVTITDAFNCSVASNTFALSVDSLSFTASLGNDTTLCAGNKIALQSGAKPNLNYLWNNGDTTATLTVVASGNYSLTATSPSGCMAKDTIAVAISGSAPIVDFSADSVCLGVATSFAAITTPATTDSVRWDFAGGGTSILSNPVYTFPTAGVANVQLTAYTNGCFSSITKSVVVYENPVAAILTQDTFCLGATATFQAANTIPSGQTTQTWWWNIGSIGTFNTQNVQTAFNTIGNFTVQYAVTTNLQCTDTFTQAVEVVLSGKPLAGAPSLITPVNFYNSTSGTITFSWNAVTNAKYYRLQVSSDSTFQSLVLDSAAAVNTLAAFLPNAATPYYWRVIAFNLCSDSAISAHRTFSSFAVGNISNLQLWLQADSGIAASPVQTWSDVSGNGFAAVQPVSSKRPTKTAAVAALNNHPVVTFSGTKFMRVLNLNQNSPLTIFALWNIAASNTVPTLFDGVAASNRVVLRQSAGSLSASAGQALAYPKSAPFNYIFNSIVYNGTNSELFENGNLKASGDLGTNAMGGLTIGANQDTSFTTYFLNGNVAEIIVYNKALSATERQQVEGYLRNKYAPPVALGPDTVISNSFCTYNLSAQQSWFTNYLWNTGATTPSIPITQTGTYSVTATDLFGYQSSDTIVIGRPVFDSLSFVPPAKTICLGDSARLSVGLPQSGFAFNWSNGDSANVIFAKTQASYAVTVTDAFNCSVASNTFALSVDSLSFTASLGNDTTLCAGNKIALQSGAKPNLNYLWNNGDTTTNIYVQNTGIYSLTVQSAAGCIFRDSITVTIRGAAPTANFGADSVCTGMFTTFTNNSIPVLPSTITAAFWDFGNGDTSTQLNPLYQYPLPGTYNVRLQVISSDTCSGDTTIAIKVFALPTASFGIDTVCVGSPVLFQDNSTVQNDQNIQGWDWNFGDATTSSFQNPIKTFNAVGDYTVSLKVTTDRLCEDSIAKVVTSIIPQPAPGAFQSFAPIDSASSASGNIWFRWNPAVNGAYYKIQIASTDNFSTLLFDSTTYQTNLLLSLPPNLGTYWWRVTAYNRCGDTVLCNTNVLFIASPNTVTGLQLWLQADSGIAASPVQTWSDVSGNGFAAVQPVSSKRPTKTAAVAALNNHPVVTFSGTKFMRVLNLNQNSPLTIFALWNIAASNTVPTLFDGVAASNRVVLRQSAGSLSASAGQALAYPKSAPFNYIFNSIVYNGTNSELFENGNLKASGDLGTNAMGGLTIGANQDTSFTTYFLNGNVAEIIVYNKALSATERQQVEGYLRNKYAPPVALGPDIKFEYGTCDTTLRIKQHFVNVLWSTGDSNVYSLKVRQSGKYWVRATDVFGFTSSDTVNVVVPYSGILPSKDTVVCAGNSVALQYNIIGTPYFYEWSTGDTGVNSITVNQSGSYFVKVSDTIGCALMSDTIHIIADSLEHFSLLNTDTLACTNTPLAPLSYLYPYQTYLWSNGSTSDTIMLAGAGTVYVTVTDVHGCTTNDSINIQVRGRAPVVDFSFNNRCFGDSTQFTDLSAATAPEQLVQWIWNMGENDTVYTQHPLKRFPLVGTFNVALTAITDSGCFARKVKPVTIGARPTPLITYNITCANASTLIADASTIPVGDTIKNWWWTLPDGSTAATKNFTHKFDSVGTYPVKLKVTSAKGCVDSTLAYIEVFPSINPSFVFDNQCVGKPTVFKDSTGSLSITKRIWKLTNTPGVITDSTLFTKTFFAPDSFDVILEVTNAIGCKDTARKTVIIYPAPVANFIDSSGCVGSTVTLQQSTVSADTVVKYEWKFGSATSKFMAPTFSLLDTGKIPVSLKVTTSKGCVDSVSKVFKTIALPKADFLFTPFFGEAPLAVSLHNQSLNATSYAWDFGNGESATDKDPSVTYLSNDTFNIRLTALNELGCADSVAKKIVVIPTNADIELLNVNIQKTPLSNGNFSSVVIARYANVGTQPIVSAQFLATLDKGTTILDDWSGYLFPGEILTHTFSSSFYVTKTSTTQYVCVDAINVNNGAEKNIANNRNCRSLDNQTVVTKLYPNPASGKIYLDIIMPDAADFAFEISNEMGQRVLADATFKAVRGYNKVDFDVRSLLPGVYFLKTTYRDNVTIQKFQVAK